MGFSSGGGGAVTLPIHVPVGTAALDSATDLGNLTIGATVGGNRVQNILLKFGNILDLSGGGATTWLAVGSGNALLTTRQQSNAADEAAAATAGAGAAPPATVQGYLIHKDSGGTDRKIPYYNV